MDVFRNAKTVRLKSVHDKYLIADDDEESVAQDRNGSTKSAKWTVEFLDYCDTIIRLKSCYGKYLTASNQPFLFGMTGRKVLQTLPKRLDSSVEWEPIRESGAVKLKTRYGQFLRANTGLPPWRNSVTHDIPHRTKTQDWVCWEVHVVEILDEPAAKPAPAEVAPKPAQPVVAGRRILLRRNLAPRPPAIQRNLLAFLDKSDSLVTSPPKGSDGRSIYFHLANEYGEIDEGFEELCITFKGNEVKELTKRLEEELGISGLTVCSRSPLNGKLYPLRLQLPPNNATLHVIVVPPSSKGRSFVLNIDVNGANTVNGVLEI
ncbi:UNVERIFIED_CONTAM: hypothetical protein Scaly_0924400 [Sesamum calycinum]|uniref:DUF569 domain-containing protein n=1 Tax=Sesamum calycinum TaxID=2727403 RepID=A0AAW2QYD1_9LAMI